MDIQEIFYWIASIVLIIIGFFVMSLIATLYYMRKIMKKTSLEIASKINEAARTWKNITLTRFVIRALRIIF